MIGNFKKLRDLGNTLLVVEHDEDTMYAADQIIDIGPGAGVHGGHVMAQGTAEEIKIFIIRLQGDYLSGRKKYQYLKTRKNGKKVHRSHGGSNRKQFKKYKCKISIRSI